VFFCEPLRDHDAPNGEERASPDRLKTCFIHLHADENKMYSRKVSTACTDSEAARRQLERVLASPGFLRNERMSRFLRFLAERHLEGQGNQLKESVIAVEVFGRKPDHDPLQDSIVRTEAGRLRGRLAEYYMGAGEDDAVVIELPKGGYTPAFRFREPASRQNLPEKKSRRGVWLVIAAVTIALAITLVRWVQKTERFWQNPIGEVRFQTLSDFDGTEQAAAVSRDGKFVAFLSSRDGHPDVWVTQPGSGQFHNLTRGSALELVNPSVRVLGFSPDGSLVTFWVRKPSGESGQIGIWAVPTLGGEARLYREGVAEFDWSHDGSRITYHTAGSGDPLFISDGTTHPPGPIFTAPAGLHSHFPLWGPDDRFIYVVYGALPDKLDIWRIKPTGGMAPERITSHNGHVSHPVLLNARTLMYLASDPDGSGPWLYSIDVEHRIPHRLTFGPDRYTSLAATADGKRLVVTRASPKSTLWRMQIDYASTEPLPPVRIALTPATTFSPRIGPDYMIFVSATGTSESIWKRANGRDTELWRGDEAQIIGSPGISPDGGRIAFSIRQRSETLLYVMQADGSNARVVADSLDLRGSPAWAPDLRSITSAANEHGVPHLFQVPVNGGRPALFLRDYSVDPAWQPSGRYVVYSGPDVGTRFSVQAAGPDGSAHSLPSLTILTRGARHLKFLSGGRGLAFLRGEIEHKDLWLIDPETGVERQLTKLPRDFNIRDFDISPDGREIVLERVQERSDIMLLDLARQ
jgi:Tol biopolymer transport system component